MKLDTRIFSASERVAGVYKSTTGSACHPCAYLRDSPRPVTIKPARSNQSKRSSRPVIDHKSSCLFFFNHPIVNDCSACACVMHSMTSESGTMPPCIRSDFAVCAAHPSAPRFADRRRALSVGFEWRSGGVPACSSVCGNHVRAGQRPRACGSPHRHCRSASPH